MRAIVNSGVLTFDQTRYSLRHSLTREALEQQMSPAELRARHRSLAAAFDSTGRSEGGGNAAARALHWWAAGDRDKAGPAMWEAARDAARSFAHAEAWEHYRKAVDLMGKALSGSAPLVIEAAEAARWTGQLGSAAGLIAAALDAPHEGDDRARLLERLGRYLWETGDFAASSAALDEALLILKESPELHLVARVEGARSRNLLTMGRYHEAELSAARAIELGGTWAPGTVMADAQITLGAARARGGRVGIAQGATSTRRWRSGG